VENAGFGLFGWKCVAEAFGNSENVLVAPFNADVSFYIVPDRKYNCLS
jgi:hypothetical protein